jgi:ATP/maltotriose-dependent transcriptional regulator MalT
MSRANTLRLLGRAEEARREAEEVFGRYRSLFGENNPLTAVAEINLANVLRARGEHNRAMTIDRVRGEALRESVGADHPFTVAAAVNLASDYALEGHPHRVAASRQAADGARRVHPADHPAVIAAEANLALELAVTGGPSAVAASWANARVRIDRGDSGLWRTGGLHARTIPD